MADYIEILTKVRDFYLEDPSRWTTGTFARKEDGTPVDALHPEAKSYCMIGVGQHLGLDDFLVSDAMGVECDPSSMKESFSLAEWNDALSFDQLIQGINNRISELEQNGESAKKLALDNLAMVG